MGELKNLLNQFEELEAAVKALSINFNQQLYFETKKKLDALELKTLFNGPYDKQNAIVSIFPGAGGEDAEDWARMLFEMYAKYADSKNWKLRILDDNPKHRSFEIEGEWVYGYLKFEAGVHRLVRISPFSAKSLRHTSFALVEVIPELPKILEDQIKIPDSDLKWEFYRSSGPGGQNVNKVETGVRVIHLPTGLSAASQSERFQIRNREKALSLLKAKIFKIMEENQIKEISGLRVKVKPEWGNQIRSYVLNPYHLVKDHRTNFETSNVDEVLNGNIEEFIESEIEILSKK